MTNMAFDTYIQKNIFDVCGMKNSGYFELDQLPEKCANNYIYLKDKNTYKTNIYAVDAKGTGAGGAFITVEDIKFFWDALLSYQLLKKETTDEMLKKQVEGDTDGSYGYGIWITANDTLHTPFFQGYDPGVSFISLYEIKSQILYTLVSNFGDGVWKELKDLRRYYSTLEKR